MPAAGEDEAGEVEGGAEGGSLSAALRCCCGLRISRRGFCCWVCAERGLDVTQPSVASRCSWRRLVPGLRGGVERRRKDVEPVWPFALEVDAPLVGATAALEGDNCCWPLSPDPAACLAGAPAALPFAGLTGAETFLTMALAGGSLDVAVTTLRGRTRLVAVGEGFLRPDFQSCLTGVSLWKKLSASGASLRPSSRKRWLASRSNSASVMVRLPRTECDFSGDRST